MPNDLRVTGLELCYYERVGYFVRRSALAASPLATLLALHECAELDRDAIVLLAESAIGVAPADLLGQNTRLTGLRAGPLPYSGTWEREATIDVDASREVQIAQLARSSHQVRCRIPLLTQIEMEVVPGTHVDPSPEESSIAIITVEPGELLFYHPNMLVREHDASAVWLEFSFSATHDATAMTVVWPADKSHTLPVLALSLLAIQAQDLAT